MHASTCPNPTTCAALVALGYAVVHCAQGEMFGLIALPNTQTLTLTAGAWVATVGRSSGFDPEDVRAVAIDRGGAVI
jgi:hypothetical protein